MTEERGAITFAERVLELLDEGRYTATYKYAVLLALIDICLERTQASGAPPDMLTTLELAGKIVEIYWPHTTPFGEGAAPSVLIQNAGGQAEIVSAITTFRERHAPGAATYWQGRSAAPMQYAGLIRSVEWKLIEMPLPRLQRMGAASVNFVYEIQWSDRPNRRDVERYAAGDMSAFDNRIHLQPRVGQYLIQLNGLLRPLIHRRWSAMVAKLNSLQDARLEEFLFGAERVPTDSVRVGLAEIQSGRCFYCDRRVVSPSLMHVDHFIPWARYPNNAIENLVIADVACNGDKGSALAAGTHVTRWSERISGSGRRPAEQLSALSAETGWDSHAERTLSVARGIYFGLPDTARLWLRRREFIPVNQEEVKRALFFAA